VLCTKQNGIQPPRKSRRRKRRNMRIRKGGGKELKVVEIRGEL
jgi:hypothetical protein